MNYRVWTMTSHVDVLNVHAVINRGRLFAFIDEDGQDIAVFNIDQIIGWRVSKGDL